MQKVNSLNLNGFCYSQGVVAQGDAASGGKQKQRVCVTLSTGCTLVPVYGRFPPEVPVTLFSQRTSGTLVHWYITVTTTLSSKNSNRSTALTIRWNTIDYFKEKPCTRVPV